MSGHRWEIDWGTYSAICPICGALVAIDRTQQHQNWHRSLTEITVDQLIEDHVHANDH